MGILHNTPPLLGLSATRPPSETWCDKLKIIGQLYNIPYLLGLFETRPSSVTFCDKLRILALLYNNPHQVDRRLFRFCNSQWIALILLGSWWHFADVCEWPPGFFGILWISSTDDDKHIKMPVRNMTGLSFIHHITFSPAVSDLGSVMASELVINGPSVPGHSPYLNTRAIKTQLTFVQWRMLKIGSFGFI